MVIKCMFDLGYEVLSIGPDRHDKRYGGIDPLTGLQKVWTIFGVMFFEGIIRHIAKAPDIEVPVPPELDNDTGEIVVEATTRRETSKLNHWFKESEIEHVDLQERLYGVTSQCTHVVKFSMSDSVEIRLPQPASDTGFDVKERDRCGVCTVDGVRIEIDKTLYHVASGDFSGWRLSQHLQLVD